MKITAYRHHQESFLVSAQQANAYLRGNIFLADDTAHSHAPVAGTESTWALLMRQRLHSALALAMLHHTVLFATRQAHSASPLLIAPVSYSAAKTR